MVDYLDLESAEVMCVVQYVGCSNSELANCVMEGR